MTNSNTNIINISIENNIREIACMYDGYSPIRRPSGNAFAPHAIAVISNNTFKTVISYGWNSESKSFLCEIRVFDKHEKKLDLELCESVSTLKNLENRLDWIEAVSDF